MGNYTKQKLTTKPKKETKEVKATIDVDSKEQGLPSTRRWEIL